MPGCAVKADLEVRAAGTHEVLNQAPPLAGYNLFASDRVLAEAVDREGAGWARPRLEEFGRLMGTEEAIRWGFQANENPPVLRTHDRFGHRIDEVEFHPAWHELMRLSVEHGLASLAWTESKPGAHVARAALMLLASQNEAGHTCPVSMTYAVVPALRKQPDLAREWEPRLHSARYDPRLRPVREKSGALMGMAMTEKQGGSDVRANTTRAEPDRRPATICSPVTSGSARRPCATRSWFWRRRSAGSPVFCCRAGRRMASATGFTSSG